MSLEPEKVDYSSYYYCRYKRNSPVKQNYGGFFSSGKYSDTEKAQAIKSVIQSYGAKDFNVFNDKFDENKDLNNRNETAKKENSGKAFEYNPSTCNIYSKPVNKKNSNKGFNIPGYNDKYTEEELDFLYKQAQLDELKEKIKNLENKPEEDTDNKTLDISENNYIPPYNYKNKYLSEKEEKKENSSADNSYNESDLTEEKEINKDIKKDENKNAENKGGNLNKNLYKINEVNEDPKGHMIEDARVDKSFKKKKHESSNPYPYDKKSKRNTKIFISVVLVCFIVLFILAETLLADDLMSSKPVWLVAGNTVATYYGISMESFVDRESAVTYSNELRKLGGGGFILKTSSYNIIAAVYASKSDALDVIDKLNRNGNAAVLYNFDVPSHNLKKYSDEQMKIISNTLMYYSVCYEDLYKLSNDVDLERISKNDIKSAVQSLLNKLAEIKNNFSNSLDIDNMDLNMIKIKAEIVAAIGIVDNLLNDNLTRPNILCDIRYSYIIIINNYINMIKSLE